jgi:hypothetical protein
MQCPADLKVATKVIGNVMMDSIPSLSDATRNCVRLGNDNFIDAISAIGKTLNWASEKTNFSL